MFLLAGLYVLCVKIMQLESILAELRNIRAHAVLTQQWADAAIKKLEGGKEKKAGRGLTDQEIANMRAKRMKTILKMKERIQSQGKN